MQTHNMSFPLISAKYLGFNRRLKFSDKFCLHFAWWRDAVGWNENGIGKFFNSCVCVWMWNWSVDNSYQFSLSLFAVQRCHDVGRHRSVCIATWYDRLLASVVFHMQHLQGTSRRSNLLSSRGKALLWTPSCWNIKATMQCLRWGEIYVLKLKFKIFH
jgi:hypothetical protein